MQSKVSDIEKLKIDFPNVAKWRLEALIEIEKEEPFSMNKWYCWYCGIMSENYRYPRAWAARGIHKTKYERTI